MISILLIPDLIVRGPCFWGITLVVPTQLEEVRLDVAVLHFLNDTHKVVIYRGLALNGSSVQGWLIELRYDGSIEIYQSHLFAVSKLNKS